ncbi:MAG: sulfite exporter TauE/SafE family protein [Actinomycetota bacterium]|nr:sulfite exporter TauE/SafE family protein [Actinomycetota bacterium]
MTPLQAAAVTAAGLTAGAMNAVVGSGTLITFPALLGIGLPPVLANTSNTVGLVAGSVSGAIGYRKELAGQRGRLLRLGGLSVAGGLTGGVLLLRLPPEAFRAIVPVLIVVACTLVVVQPRLAAQLRTRRGGHSGGLPVLSGVYGTGIYGGYFGAAQGVLLIGIMGLFLDETLQRLNAAKNVLAGLVNFTAALLFIAVGQVAWDAAGLIAAGSIVGGHLGARVGRRLPDTLLRGIIVVVGLVAVWQLLPR